MPPLLMVREGETEGDKGGGRNVPLLMVREGGTEGDKGGGRNDPPPAGEGGRDRG